MFNRKRPGARAGRRLQGSHGPQSDRTVGSTGRQNGTEDVGLAHLFPLPKHWDRAVP